MGNSFVKNAGAWFFEDSNRIVSLLVGVLIILAMGIAALQMYQKTTTYRDLEISNDQYLLIQNGAYQGAAVSKKITQALSDNKITQAEYAAIKASQEAVTNAEMIEQKSEMIEQIKTDAQTKSANKGASQ